MHSILYQLKIFFLETAQLAVNNYCHCEPVTNVTGVAIRIPAMICIAQPFGLQEYGFFIGFASSE